MYYDKKRDRVLLRDGRSIVTPETFARMTLKGEDTSSLCAIDGEESRKYDLIYGARTSSEIEEVFPYPESHEHTQEQLDTLIGLLVSSDRYSDDLLDRLETELEFFDRTNNVTFLLECVRLVERMIEDGVVYGVGRGSMCASLVLYLLKLHDIDPVKYDIPFEEFSKEQNYE